MSLTAGTRPPSLRGAERARAWLRLGPWVVTPVVLLVPLMALAPPQRLQVAEGIAVLPLENLSGDPRQEYLAGGLHDALISTLGQVSGFKHVIGLDSARRFKTAKTPLSEVARQLKVDALVTGGVLRSGGRVRVTARLVDGKTEAQLWIQTYERDLGELPVLENEIVAAVAGAANVKLTRNEAARLGRARPVDPDAYDAYLHGQSLGYQLNRQGLDEALKYFTRAVEKDPGFARAHAAVSRVWSSRMWQTYTRPTDAMPHAREAVLKSLELDPTLAEAHFRLAGIKTWTDWDWPGADKAFRRAIELNPSYVGARSDYSHYLSIVRRPKEAFEQTERAMALDPLNPTVRAFHAMDLMYVHRYDEAIALLRDALETSPNHGQVLSNLRSAYHLKQMYEEALGIWKAGYVAGGDRDAEEALARGFKEAGYQGALQRVAELLIARAQATYVTPWQIATLYTRAGKIPEALEWLHKACDVRDPNMPYINADPVFDVLRAEPRFQDLRRRMKLPG